MNINRVAGTVGKRGLALSALCCGVLAVSPSFAQSSSFQGVGFLPGGTYSRMSGVSADGSIVVGYGSSTAAAGSDEAFRWTSSTGIVGLGLLPGATYSYANGISADGLTVTGDSDSAASGNASEAFRWTQATGMVGLGFLPGGTQSSGAAVNADGSVIVGSGDSTAAGGNYEAYRWTQATGMVGLGFLAGGSESYASGVNADGSVVVGGSASTVAGGNYEAFRWTQASGMVGLGLLTGGTQSNATAVSANGNVVVGFATSAAAGGNYEAFRWTQATGIVGLGFLPGGSTSSAYGTSADGVIVVGTSSTASVTNEAFRWTQANGMQSVNALLVAAGVNMTGWLLERADGVSALGNIIVGSGVNPGGQSEAWIARLCDIPAGACTGAPSLITVSNQLQSLSSLGAVGQTANASLGVNFGTVTSEVMQNGNAARNGSRFSVFTAFGYDSDPTVSGTLGGTAKLNDRGLLIGATAGADNIHTTNMSDGGSARMNAGTAGIFLAQVPQQGLQWLIGANAIYLNGKITRGYLNGISQVNSTGSTHGTGYGLTGRIGYTFADLLPRTQVTPFISYAYTRVGFSGYTENDGPVPAMIDSFRDIQQVSRVGADMRYTFKPGIWTWGTLAWGHRLGGHAPDVSGTLIGLFPLSASGGAVMQRDWLEATAGVRFGLWTNGAMTASLTANVPTQTPTTYVARIGLSQSF